MAKGAAMTLDLTPIEARLEKWKSLPPITVSVIRSIASGHLQLLNNAPSDLAALVARVKELEHDRDMADITIASQKKRHQELKADLDAMTRLRDLALDGAHEARQKRDAARAESRHYAEYIEKLERTPHVVLHTDYERLRAIEQAAKAWLSYLESPENSGHDGERDARMVRDIAAGVKP